MQRPNSDSDGERDADDRKGNLFRGPVQSDLLLARTLFRELVQSGRTTADVLSFVNCLLGVVIDSSGRNSRKYPVEMIDPSSALPTRAGIHALVVHELDADNDSGRCAGVILAKLTQLVDLPVVAMRVRHALRASDVVALLRPGVLVAVVYPRQPEDIERVRARVHQILRANFESTSLQVVASMLTKGALPRHVWSQLLRKLRNHSSNE